MKIAYCGYWRRDAEVQGKEPWQAELIPPSGQNRVAVVAARKNGSTSVTWHADIKTAKRQAQKMLSREGATIWAVSVEYLPEPGGIFVRK